MAILELHGKSAVVAGAGQGIGEATALLLARAGARVAVVDRHRDRAERVVAAIGALAGAGASGGEAIAIVADVGARRAAELALAQAEAAFGSLDLVANIIGSATFQPLFELDDSNWERDLQTNLNHHVFLARAAARRWVERGRPGAYCGVASVSGLFSSAQHAAYGAAKAAMISFIRSAAEEWAPHRIRVNAVAPGAVLTPRIAARIAARAAEAPGGAGPSEEQLARMAFPEDVAGSIAFLLSDLARRITGQVLVLDGGASTRFPYAVG